MQDLITISGRLAAKSFHAWEVGVGAHASRQKL
jgi:hypothetical protein